MNKSEIQRGSLRKRNLPKPSTLRDLRPAMIEYRNANELWARPGSIEIVDVRAADGEPIEPGEYWLFVQENGFFPTNADLPLTKENGRWERL